MADDDRDTLVESLREQNNGGPQGQDNQQDQHDDPPDDQDLPDDQDQDDDQDDQSGHDHGDEDQAQQRQSRGSERIRRQQELNRQERERADRLERELAEERARSAARAEFEQTQLRQREAAEEQQAMAAMSDGERATYLMAKELKGLKGALAQQQRQSQDSTDRIGFDAMLRANPRFEKYRAKVEDMARQVSSQGGFLAREIILDTLIGRDLRTSNSGQRQREEARERVDNARGQNRSPRGDAPPQRRNNGKLTLAQRMERDDPVI